MYQKLSYIRSNLIRNRLKNIYFEDAATNMKHSIKIEICVILALALIHIL